MEKLFLQIINMGITSTYIILFIIVVRLLLKKAPKIFSYLLWAIPFLRLIFPFSFQSVFSLLSINTNTIPEDIVYSQTPQIESGISALDSRVNGLLPAADVAASANPMQVWISIGSIVWLMGIGILLFYSIYTTLKLSKKLKSASLLEANIYKMDNLDTAFVFGLIRPKIYLPKNLSKNEESYIIKHEETHIRRLDHIIKFIAFLIVSLHWFNPIVWIGFYLMVEDMELSCDESVIRDMGHGIKKDYSNSLLSLSIGRRIGGSPIAFGENNTRARIKNILNYKEPKFWVIIVALLIVLGLGLGLLSNPLGEESEMISKLDFEMVKELSLEGVEEELTIVIHDYVDGHDYLSHYNVDFEQDKFLVDPDSEVKKFNNIKVYIDLKLDAEGASITSEEEFDKYADNIAREIKVALRNQRPTEYLKVEILGIGLRNTSNDLFYGLTFGETRNPETLLSLRSEESEVEKQVLEKIFDAVGEDREFYGLVRLGIFDNGPLWIEFLNYAVYGIPNKDIEELSDHIYELVREDEDFAQYIDNKTDTLFVIFNDTNFEYDLKD